MYASGLKLKDHHRKPKLQSVKLDEEVLDLPASVDWNALGKVSIP